MAKTDLTTLTVSQLMALAMSDRTQMQSVTEEIERRNNAPKPAEIEVDYNSAGQIFVREGTATTVSSKGTLYRGSANVVTSIMRLICADDDTGKNLRKRVNELLTLPKEEIAKRVAAKQDKKLARLASEAMKNEQTAS